MDEKYEKFLVLYNKPGNPSHLQGMNGHQTIES